MQNLTYYDYIHVHENPPEHVKKQKEKVFFALGDNKWKEIIDFYDHTHGPNVYDEGSHGFQAEHGYLAGAKAAFEVAAKYIGQETSVAIYKEIHQAACSHFNTKDLQSKVLINGHDAGKFTRGRLHAADFDQLSHDPQPSTQKWIDRLVQVEKEVAAVAKKLGLAKPLVTFYLKPDSYLEIVYTHFSDDELESATAILFDRFNQKARRLQEQTNNLTPDKEQYKTAIRKTIAKLFQRLEWLHPYPDGQGRTDLILQAKLCTDYGLHPPILLMPYDSSVFTLDEWNARLLIGLGNWQMEKPCLT